MIACINYKYGKRIAERPLVFFPLASQWYQPPHKQLQRRKYIFAQHGFWDATYEIKFFDPIRMGYYAIWIGD